MVHGIHAAAARVDPLVIRGDPFDTEVVHFPGEISDCTTCHINDSFELPLASGVLASTTDMGADAADPADDVMITPVSAVCASCHDDNLAVSHMEQNGGDFSATESSIDSGASTETCTVCHGPDRISDVKAVHLSPQ